LPEHIVARRTRGSSLDYPAQRLRTRTAAVRLAISWLGVRKTLTPEQKSQSAESFGAQGNFLSAGICNSSIPNFTSRSANASNSDSMRLFNLPNKRSATNCPSWSLTWPCSRTLCPGHFRECRHACRGSPRSSSAARLGIVLLTNVPYEHEPDRQPRMFDWDEHDRRRVYVDP
jgi:hypothetical protein